jgi:hypothetical protein
VTDSSATDGAGDRRSPVLRPQSRVRDIGFVETTGEFELRVLTDAHASQRPLSLGAPPSTMTVVTTRDEMVAAINRIAASAQRLLSIYTPDLEPELYDTNEFLDIVKHFVLGRNFAKVRVMLGDPSRVQRDTNRFMAMGRRLTSYIEIRPEQKPIPQSATSYIIADDRAVLLRPRANEWEGVANFDNRAIARAQLDQFDALWQAHQPEFRLRVSSR